MLREWRCVKLSSSGNLASPGLKITDELIFSHPARFMSFQQRLG
jgi:hypothetical protein